MAVAIANSSFNETSAVHQTWGFTPATGSILIVFGTHRAGTLVLPTGWTTIYQHTADSFHSDLMAIYKISAGETSLDWNSGIGSSEFGIYEITGANISTLLSNHDTATGTACSGGSVTPSGSSAVILGAMMMQLDGDITFSPGAGYTEDFDGTGVGGQPESTFVHQIVTPPSGSYNPNSTAGTSGTWKGITVALSSAAVGRSFGVIV